MGLADGTIDVVDVAYEARAAGSAALYTYRAPRGARVGQSYLAPLGARMILGWIMGVRSVHESELAFDVKHLRELGARAEDLDLAESTVRLIHEVAEEYLCPVSVALGPATPPGASQRLRAAYRLTGVAAPSDLSAVERETVLMLQDVGGELADKGLRQLTPGVRRALARLKALGVVEFVARIETPRETHRLAGAYRLTPDQARLAAFLERNGRAKPAQSLALVRLQGAEMAAMDVQEIKTLTQASDATLKALIAGRVLEPAEDMMASASRPTPNVHQRRAIEVVTAAVRERQPHGYLLHGVTGSGKTEVYLAAAEQALRLGRQALYLVPEIGLTLQAVARLRSRFGTGVALLHSRLSTGARVAAWRQIRRGETPLVIGTRSALFAPMSDLGLIVLDEEHDSSYKQDSSPKYHAHRLAQGLAVAHRCPLVFGSATPSLETAKAAVDGALTLLEIHERATAASLPEVHVVDLKAVTDQVRPSLFSPVLSQKLRETISRGEQAILFMNRRAFAPFLLCRACGYNWPCPNCSVTLSFHRREAKMQCHHCDHRRRAPDLCPLCQSTRIRPVGAGAQKVEEAFRAEFPGVTVARLDRDVARVKGAIEETLASFGSRRVQVLVGTQMVAKGLDFPGVTLVGVIAADVSLNLPDFRASERAFQLLSQVAGRAGRGDRPGEVVIQTFSPEHLAVRCAVTHDYRTLFEALLDERRAAAYPPFSRLVSVEFRGAHRGEVVRASVEARDLLAKAMALAPAVLGEVALPALAGPADCVVERLNGLWRRRLLVKLPPEESAGRMWEALREFAPERVDVLLDVDPYALE